MNQDVVNELAMRVRREVIFALLKKSFLDHRISMPDKEQMAYEIEQIAELPCKTKLLKNLFADAEELRNERGMFPSPPTISELRFCCEHRKMSYSCIQNVKFGFIPNKDDTELRMLPSVKQMLGMYGEAIKAGEKILFPKQSDATNNVAMQIANKVAESIMIGGAR
jgi:hypothetical protein